MNAPLILRSVLRMHLETIEARFPLRIVGLLSRGSVAHVDAEDALYFLAEKREGLSLLDLARPRLTLPTSWGVPSASCCEAA